MTRADVLSWADFSDEYEAKFRTYARDAKKRAVECAVIASVSAVIFAVTGWVVFLGLMAFGGILIRLNGGLWEDCNRHADACAADAREYRDFAREFA